MNKILENIETAHRFDLVENTPDYMCTEKAKGMIKGVLGENLDEVMKGCITESSKIVPGVVPQAFFIESSFNYLLGRGEVTEWAKKTGDTNYTDPMVYMTLVGVFAKEFAKEQGWIKQDGDNIHMMYN